MSPLQFGLFFAALLIGYVLVHLRLVRFESYLREIAGLRQLNERLQGVSDSLKRVSISTLEDRVDMVHAELREIREAALRLERTFSERPVAIEAPALTTEPTLSEADRVRTVVESRLLALGYGSLHILTDLNTVSLDEGGEVTVECEKAQIAHKGKVVVGNGGVRDVRLQSVTQSFP